jgi:hypothetical protein
VAGKPPCDSRTDCPAAHLEWSLAHSATTREWRVGRLEVVLTHVTATWYVTPLREDGSLPGLMEADDLGTYVVK